MFASRSILPKQMGSRLNGASPEDSRHLVGFSSLPYGMVSYARK